MIICRLISTRSRWSSLLRTFYACASGSAKSSLPSSRSAFPGFSIFPCQSFSLQSLVDTWFDFHRANIYISKRYVSGGACIESPSLPVVEVPLAQTGEGIAECELLKWFVQEGDHVEEFQPICEVQSDKATIEITSRYKGRIFQTLYVPGDIIKVGDTILKIVVEEAHNLKSNFDALKDAFLNSEIDASDIKNSMLGKENSKGSLSTPFVRNLAKEYGVNIKDICGTGKDGRVLEEDVIKHASEKGTYKDSSDAFSEQHTVVNGENAMKSKVQDQLNFEDETILLRGFQRSMIKSMTMAAKIPHFYYLEEINCDALVELKAAFQSENTDPAVKHTFLPFLIKSLSVALCEYPTLNSSFLEESDKLILKGSHNIGVAMATSNGLVVPNIKNVQSLSILQITKELLRLQHLAMSNKLSSVDISGGTITLSNIGAIGGKVGTPLLNLPEVAIIALGRIQKLPRFADDGNIYPASMANIAIGADHRVVDGATVATFCNEWKLLIENPELLILRMR